MNLNQISLYLIQQINILLCKTSDMKVKLYCHLGVVFRIVTETNF